MSEGKHSPPAGEPWDELRVAELIARELPGLRRLVGRRAGNTELGNEIVADAICETWQHLLAGRIKVKEQIAGYVFQVSINILRNYRRNADNRHDRRAPADVLETLASAEQRYTQPSEEKNVSRVRRMVSSLPTPRDRDIVKRYYLDEEEKETICRDLGLTPLHFDKVIFRARQRMRALLEAEGYTKGDFFSLLLVCFG